MSRPEPLASALALIDAGIIFAVLGWTSPATQASTAAIGFIAFAIGGLTYVAVAQEQRAKDRDDEDAALAVIAELQGDLRSDPPNLPLLEQGPLPRHRAAGRAAVAKRWAPENDGFHDRNWARHNLSAGLANDWNRQTAGRPMNRSL